MATTSNGKKAIEAGIGYTIGNILIRGLSFVVLPLFSRLMNTEQFGIYNGFVAVDSILYVITGLALHSSVKSAHYTFEGKTDRYISSLSLVYLINFTALFAIVTLFGNSIGQLLKLPIPALYMLLLYSSGSAILTLYLNRISLDYSYKKYLALSLVNTVGSIVLSLLLMLSIFKGERAMGRIIGSSVTIAAIAIYLLVEMWRKARPRYDRDFWKFGITYSLPIIPHGISQVLLSQFDRIMIRSLDSDESAGIYSLAAYIKIILTIISDSISEAWTTWFFEEYDKGNNEIIRKRASQLSWGFAFFTVGVMAVAPEIILILGGKAYLEGKYVAYPMIVDAFILFLYNIIVPSEYYKKKTQYIMAGTIVAAIINVITNYIFIRAYGYIAAAYTTLFSYICYVVLHMIISRKLLGYWIIPLRDVFHMAAVMCVAFVLNTLLVDAIVIRYLCNVVGLSVFAFLLYRTLKRDNIDVIALFRNKFHAMTGAKRHES